MPGKPGAREIGRDKLTYYGGALSLAPVQAQLRDYFVLQSITVAISMFRLLKYLALNPLFGGLIETFIIVKMQLVQFVLIVCTLNVGFAYMAVLLFGDVMQVLLLFLGNLPRLACRVLTFLQRARPAPLAASRDGRQSR